MFESKSRKAKRVLIDGHKYPAMLLLEVLVLCGVGEKQWKKNGLCVFGVSLFRGERGKLPTPNN